MLSYTSRKTCRVCGSSDLSPVLSLGLHYVNDFPEAGRAYSGASCPIELVTCNHCTLVQNPHTAPQELLYTGHYWYKSGTTGTMQKALADVVKAVQKEIKLKPFDIALDIGSNDGTLLRNYPYEVNKVGVEPASNMREIGSQGIDTLISNFWGGLNLDVLFGGEKIKAITACGMFYDLDDPNRFIEDVAKVLHPEGVFIAQLMCLSNMINVGDIGNLAHEHLEFYTLKSLEYLLGGYGLEVYKIEVNSVNGESYRLYIQHKGLRPIHLSVPFYTNKETDILERLKSFWSRMEENKNKVVNFLRRERFHGKKIYGYGASTKGNTILQYYGLEAWDLVAIAEKDNSKWGKVTVGSNIPIVSESQARNSCPDYFFVLPYCFRDEFIERESSFLQRGGKFIFPLPTFEIVGL